MFLLSSGHIIWLTVSNHTHTFMDDAIPRLGHANWNGVLVCHWHSTVYCSACVPEMQGLLGLPDALVSLLLYATCKFC